MNFLRWTNKLTPILNKSPEFMIFSKEYPNSDNTETYRKYTFTYYDKDEIDTLLQDDNNINEIIPDSLPRKFFVDIDIKPSEPNYTKYSFDEIIVAMNEIVKYTVTLVDKNMKLDESLIRVLYVKNINRKKSLHLIYPFALRSCQEGKYFSSLVNSVIKDDTIQTLKDYQDVLYDSTIGKMYFDLAVYSSNQNFRMCYQTKLMYPNYHFEPYDETYTKPSDYFVGIYESRDSYIYFNNVGLKELTLSRVTKFINTKHKKDATNAQQLEGMIRKDINVALDLRPYDENTIAPNYIAADSIEFYVSCIPNSNESPQPYHVWLGIGQSLRNIAGDDAAKQTKYLTYWINWSNRASGEYPNEDTACANVWKRMDTKKEDIGNTYKKTHLYDLAMFYAPKAVRYFETISMSSDLFLVNRSIFDNVDEYCERYCKPLIYRRKKLPFLVVSKPHVIAFRFHNFRQA